MTDQHYFRIKNMDTNKELLLGVHDSEVVCFDENCVPSGAIFSKNCEHVQEARRQSELRSMLKAKGAKF